MRLFISVVLLAVLGGCAGHDRGYGPAYGHGPDYGPSYGPVYGPGYGYYSNGYRVEPRVIHVPVYRHYEPRHQPSYRQPERRLHAPRVVNPGRPALAPGYSHEHQPHRGQRHDRSGRDDGRQHAPRQPRHDSGHRGWDDHHRR